MTDRANPTGDFDKMALSLDQDLPDAASREYRLGRIKRALRSAHNAGKIEGLEEAAKMVEPYKCRVHWTFFVKKLRAHAGILREKNP